MKLKMMLFVGCVFLFSFHYGSSQPLELDDMPASENAIEGSHSFDRAVNHHHRHSKKEKRIETGKTNFLPWGYRRFDGCSNVKFGIAYKFYPIKKTWREARLSCLREGAYLAYPDCAAEERIYVDLLKHLNSGGAWLGMHDLIEEGNWVTEFHGKVNDLSYVNWAPTEPNNYGEEGEDCAELYEGQWYDTSCEKELFYVCKMDLDLNQGPAVIKTKRIWDR